MLLTCDMHSAGLWCYTLCQCACHCATMWQLLLGSSGISSCCEGQQYCSVQDVKEGNTNYSPYSLCPRKITSLEGNKQFQSPRPWSEKPRAISTPSDKKVQTKLLAIWKEFSDRDIAILARSEGMRLLTRITRFMFFAPRPEFRITRKQRWREGDTRSAGSFRKS
jgi:hypothetical protein